MCTLVWFGLKTRVMNLLIVTRLVGDGYCCDLNEKLWLKLNVCTFFWLRLNHWMKKKTNFVISVCWICHFVQMSSGDSAFSLLLSKNWMIFFLSHRKFVCSRCGWFFFLSHSFISQWNDAYFKCSIMKKSITTESITQNRIENGNFLMKWLWSISVTSTKQINVWQWRYVSQIMAADCYGSIFSYWFFKFRLKWNALITTTNTTTTPIIVNCRRRLVSFLLASLSCAFCVKVERIWVKKKIHEEKQIRFDC